MKIDTLLDNAKVKLRFSMTSPLSKLLLENSKSDMVQNRHIFPCEQFAIRTNKLKLDVSMQEQMMSFAVGSELRSHYCKTR